MYNVCECDIMMGDFSVYVTIHMGEWLSGYVNMWKEKHEKNRKQKYTNCRFPNKNSFFFSSAFISNGFISIKLFTSFDFGLNATTKIRDQKF